MKKVLIAGGSGLIGTRLTQLLLEKGYAVSHLSRKKSEKNNIRVFNWDADAETIDERAFHGTDSIINLAGAGIAEKAWTAARKNEIIRSRVNAANTIFKFLKSNHHTISTYIGSSAIGYYGNLSQKNIIEEDVPGDKDFLSRCCIMWEVAHQQMNSLNIRTAITRTGIVLSDRGGALKEMLMPFKFFTGAYFGNGKMETSWIHIDDLCAMIIFLLENKTANGVYNAVAPNPVTNYKLIKAVSKIKNALFLMQVPKVVLQLMLGERHRMLFQSLHVSCGKILKAGFKFRFEIINEALKNLLTN